MIDPSPVNMMKLTRNHFNPVFEKISIKVDYVDQPFERIIFFTKKFQGMGN